MEVEEEEEEKEEEVEEEEEVEVLVRKVQHLSKCSYTINRELRYMF